MHKMIREELENSIYRLRTMKKIEAAYYAKTFKNIADLIDYVRSDLYDVRNEVRAEKASSVAAVEAPATYNDFYDMLWSASRARMSFGATDAQIRLLARLAVEQGLTRSQMNMTTLTKSEASAMIDHMKKG